MIFKTLYTRNSASGWMGYIAYNSQLGDVDASAKGLFNNLGDRARRDDIVWIAKMSKKVKITRMFIFAPARYIEPLFLRRYTRDAMWEMMDFMGIKSARFVYALHYNTAHPHSHVVMTSTYAEELMMFQRSIEKVGKVIERVFQERMAISDKIKKEPLSEEERRYMEKFAEFERFIMEEQSKEEVEIRHSHKKFRSVEDVIKFAGVGAGL